MRFNFDAYNELYPRDEVKPKVVIPSEDKMVEDIDEEVEEQQNQIIQSEEIANEEITPE